MKEVTVQMSGYAIKPDMYTGCQQCTAINPYLICSYMPKSSIMLQCLLYIHEECKVHLLLHMHVDTIWEQYSHDV